MLPRLIVILSTELNDSQFEMLLCSGENSSSFVLVVARVYSKCLIQDELATRDITLLENKNSLDCQI